VRNLGPAVGVGLGAGVELGAGAALRGAPGDGLAHEMKTAKTTAPATQASAVVPERLMAAACTALYHVLAAGCHAPGHPSSTDARLCGTSLLSPHTVRCPAADRDPRWQARHDALIPGDFCATLLGRSTAALVALRPAPSHRQSSRRSRHHVHPAHLRADGGGAGPASRVDR
jgi:hypothetical protein